MNLDKNIAYYRKLCGYTQEQLAERLGVTGQSVSKWETGVSSPDVSLLSDLAGALGVDMNALFADDPVPLERFEFSSLTERCYDSLVRMFFQHQRGFYGAKTALSAAEFDRRVEEIKSRHAFPMSMCSYFIDEGDPQHGAVFLSDALSFVDRSYGGTLSEELFDLDRGAELLSVLANRDVRRLLRIVYHNLITGGEAASTSTPEELAVASGLSVEAVSEAAVLLRHVALLDETETLTPEGRKKEYSIRSPKDFIFVIAILRLAYIQCANPNSTAVMYRFADGTLNYDADAI